MKKIFIGLIAFVLCCNAFGMKKSMKEAKLQAKLVAHSEFQYRRKSDLMENILDEWLEESLFFCHISSSWFDNIKKKIKTKMAKRNSSNGWFEELIDFWLDQQSKEKSKNFSDGFPRLFNN